MLLPTDKQSKNVCNQTQAAKWNSAIIFTPLLSLLFLVKKSSMIKDYILSWTRTADPEWQDGLLHEIGTG